MWTGALFPNYISENIKKDGIIIKIWYMPLCGRHVFLFEEKHGKIFKILIKKWLLIISLSIKKLIYRLLE